MAITYAILLLAAGLAVYLAADCAIQAYAAALRRVCKTSGRGTSVTLLLAMVGFTYWAGGKGGAPIRSVPPPSLHGYLSPTNFATDASVFVRPPDAETPALWQTRSVCDDFQPVAPGYVAGICGVATTQPFGFTHPGGIGAEYDAYAPFHATNSLLHGVGDFWTATNDYSQCFVWKDVAFNRDPSNLVSFALRLYDWGDVEYIYGNVPKTGFSSFVKKGDDMFDMTSLCASGQTVRLEKILEQDTEWWLENYPGLCFTNETGELVFDYDTNEWYMVEFQFEVDKEQERNFLLRHGSLNIINKSRASQEYLPVSVHLSDENAYIVFYIGAVERSYNDKIYIKLGKDENTKTLRLGFRYGYRNRVFAYWENGNNTKMIKNVSVDSHYGVVCTRLDSRSFELLRPITMRILNSAPPGARYMNLAATLSPSANGGTYEWTAEGDLRIAGSSGCHADVVADGDCGGTVHCLWRKDGASATGSVHVAANELLPNSGAKYLDLSFASPEVFFEPEHLGTNGVAVQASIPPAQMTCTCRSTLPGTLTLEAAPFQNDSASLFLDGQPVTLPATWTLNGTSHLEFTVVVSGHSTTEDGISFLATFTPNDGGTFSDGANIVFKEVRVEAAEIFPDDGPRHVFGPMETVKVSVDPHGEGAGAVEFGPFFAVTNTVLSVSGYSFPISVIGPQSIVASNPRPIDTNEIAGLSFTPAAPGEFGASFTVDLHCLPDFVSFTGINTTEGVAAPSGVWGYFASHSDALSMHDAGHGAGAVVGVTNGNYAGRDSVGYSISSLALPLSNGGYQWEIPVFWSIPGHSTTNRFTTNIQTFTLAENGDFTVSKFGCSATRGTNGVQRIVGGN